MKTEKRTVRLELTLTNTEHEQLKIRMGLAKIKTVNNFLRLMALRGYIINLDIKPLLEPTKIMWNISNNINQIAARINSTNNIYAEDMAELEENYEQLSKATSEIVGYIRRLEQ